MKHMKPFNLDAAMAGDPIITRVGAIVKFVAYVPEAKPAAQVVYFLDGVVYTASVTGSYWGDGELSRFDLFIAPKKRTVWVNLYAGADAAMLHNSQEDADDKRAPHRVGGKAYPIEIDE